MPDAPPTAGPHRLVSLGGVPATPALLAELRQLRDLPASVRDAFWELLEPNLGAEVSERAEADVGRFCARHDVEAAALVPVVRSSRLLIRRAAELDVAIEAFAEDLTAVGDEETARVLLACYARAHPRLRVERVLAGLADFGAVLDDVRARVDVVPASRHDRKLAVPVVMLSLRYQEAGQARQVTVQVAPVVLAQLQATLGALGGPG